MNLNMIAFRMNEYQVVQKYEPFHALHYLQVVLDVGFKDELGLETRQLDYIRYHISWEVGLFD